MYQQFRIRLCRCGLAGLVGYVGTSALFMLGGFIASKLLPTGGNGQFALLLLLGIGGCYGVYRVARKVAVHETLVTVEPAGLTVTCLLESRQLYIYFADVVSYRDELLNNGRELRFRLRSGQKVKLAVNWFLGDTGDYNGMLLAVQQAVSKYNRIYLSTVNSEKSFSEKPIAIILLAIVGTIFLLVISDVIRQHNSLMSWLVLIIGAIIFYPVLWLTAYLKRPE
ncbi:MAG: hypothetical protein ACRYFX_12460 [Janthinobacterium lividum]